MSHSVSRGIKEVQTTIFKEVDGSQAADTQSGILVEGEFDHLAVGESFGTERTCVVLRISWSKLSRDVRTDDELCGRREE